MDAKPKVREALRSSSKGRTFSWTANYRHCWQLFYLYSLLPH